MGLPSSYVSSSSSTSDSYRKPSFSNNNFDSTLKYSVTRKPSNDLTSYSSGVTSSYPTSNGGGYSIREVSSVRTTSVTSISSPRRSFNY